MLVVIVVAAATAFSFFVAAYQKQLQAQETLNHDRALETVKVVGLSELDCAASVCYVGPGSGKCSGTCFAEVSFVVASLDVNAIGVVGLYLDHAQVINYTATIRGSTISPCFNASAPIVSPTYGVGTCSDLILPGYATATITFNLGDCLNSLCSENGVWALGVGEGPSDYESSSVFVLTLLTSLGNQFTESLTPPVPIASVYFVASGTSTIPVFDGLGSFQPKEADNASIDQYAWAVTLGGVQISDPDCGNNGVGSGGQFECSGLTDSDTYSVTLAVTNSDGLSASTSIFYTQQD